MTVSPLRLVKRWQPPAPRSSIALLPSGLRGIYVLYKANRAKTALDVVYVGMATAGRRGGMKTRLRRHLKTKAGLWSHFGAFEVWDNISEDEIAELEGLFRQIYRLDSRANCLNKQRSFKKLGLIGRIIDDVTSD